jgi:hypothetical protein
MRAGQDVEDVVLVGRLQLRVREDAKHVALVVRLQLRVREDARHVALVSGLRRVTVRRLAPPELLSRVRAVRLCVERCVIVAHGT